MFLEVKVDPQILSNRRSRSEPLAVPDRFPAPVRFPSRWRAGARSGDLRVALDELLWRD